MIEIRHKETGAVLLTLDRADLRGAYLARTNLAGAYLARTNLVGANLRGADLRGVNLAGANLADANLARASLARADLRGADLRGAYLDCADLAATDLIDGGQEARGYRFWAWRRADGAVIVRGGCRVWIGVEAARAHYGADYDSNGDRAECLARIALLEVVAKRKGWTGDYLRHTAAQASL